MNFIADKQTLEDLNLLGKYKPNSIFSIFNQVKTRGGEKLLEEMFRRPLMDHNAINERSTLMQYFQQQGQSFPLHSEDVSAMENYLDSGQSANLAASLLGLLSKRITAALFRDESYDLIQSGLAQSLAVLKDFRAYTLKFEGREHPFREQLLLAESIFNDGLLQEILLEPQVKAWTMLGVLKYDFLLKNKLNAGLRQLLGVIYQLDVYIAVGRAASAGNLAYAQALPREGNCFHAEGLWHPGIKDGTGNALSLSGDSNLVFLTGANMAGKSTLMKALGINFYLAHMGFPVAATTMDFSVKDGLYTSINVADSLDQGYSHFYAEVLRVKKVAGEVSSHKELLVIFDELFKGTNVKDAYDATLAVTEEFSFYRNCFFVISTHIIEVAAPLQDKCPQIQLRYLPTVMNGNVPAYTYRLEEGISADRHGMTIIENEKILEMLAD
jgi:DNA mismatch repair protein MutS